MRVFAAVALAAAAASASPMHEEGKPVRFDLALAAGKVHEECLPIAAGKARKYAWKSTAPVDFNIHYHHGKDVHFGAKSDAASTGSGEFRARTREDYCWMWTALKDTRVSGTIE